jgi:hypothetical protein
MLQHVDAVAVCSPDSFHASQVHTALTARRHVVCEFPLASSVSEASSLYALSIARDRVLHVEHIELLTPACLWIRNFAQGRTLQGGTVRFTGRTHPNAHSPAHANLARIQRIIDAVGSPDSFRLERCKTDHLAVLFRYGDAELAMDCRMTEDGERHMELVLELGDGIVRQEGSRLYLDGEEIDLPDPGGLFKADQLAATSAILDGVESYANMERVLEGLTVAEQLMGAA